MMNVNGQRNAKREMNASRKKERTVKNVSGQEYELKECPGGRINMSTGDVLQVPIFRDNSCGKAEDCTLKCEHKEKKF
jgi:hypothetical protein